MSPSTHAALLSDTCLTSQMQEDTWSLLAFSLDEKARVPGSGRDPASEDQVESDKGNTRCPFLAPVYTDVCT